MTTTRTLRPARGRTGKALGIVLALTASLTACGSSNKASVPASTAAAAATTAAPATTAAAANSQVGGSVAADGTPVTAAPATTAAASATTAAAAPATAAAASATTAAASSATTAAPASANPSAASGSAATVPPVPRTTMLQNQQNPLRAGSSDDNEKFGDYLTYVEKAKALGVRSRDLDPSDRTIVRIVGSDGVPYSSRLVTIRQGRSDVVTLTTTADGTIRFHPHAYSGQSQGDYTANVGQTSLTLQPGQTQRMLLPSPAASQGRVKVDVLFLLDATGSMGDEIDQLKATIRTVADQLSNLPSQPDIRLGLTSYRDSGDAYLTRTADFTSNIQTFAEALDKTYAEGGGDIPEAVDEALSAGLTEPNWRSDAIGLVFLVADAGPHIDRKVQTPYTASMKQAAARGIKIFPVASSNTDDAAEFAFRQIAQFTGARFVFLSYGAAGAAVGPSTDIQKSDYQDLALNDLIVRLVAEELAARRGS